MNWILLSNSILVATLTTVGSVALGFAAALGLAGLRSPWRYLALGGAVGVLVMPPFLVANCWLHYLGLNGAWTPYLPVRIHSMGGTIFLLILTYWPLTLLLTLAAWRQLDRDQMEQDPALSGASLIRWLLGPMAWPSLKLSGAITFVLALNSFTVPALLQVKVLPAMLWVRFNTTFNVTEALLLGWPLVLLPVLLLYLVRHQTISWNRPASVVTPLLWRRQLGLPWMGLGLGLALIGAVLSTGLPLSQLVFSSDTWTEIPVVLKAAPGPLWQSFCLALMTSLGCLGVALFTCRWSWMQVGWLPFLIPGVLLGILLIKTFNHPGLQAIYQSSLIVLLGWGLRYQVLCWQGLHHAYRQSDPDLRDAARLGGASFWMTMRHVHWPQMAPMAAATVYLTFLFCLWDVETLILVVPPGGETLALRVFNLLHYGHNAQVNAMCLLLLLVAVFPLLCWGTRQWIRNREVVQ